MSQLVIKELKNIIANLNEKISLMEVDLQKDKSLLPLPFDVSRIYDSEVAHNG